MTRVLVANRGEIALRVIRAAHDLGYSTVAVYSAADAGQPHVRFADSAVAIGPAVAARSYLDIDAVIAAARRTGADIVHPGYGFLAERAEFAQACEREGLTLAGPGSEAIALMGDKVAAREVAQRAGVSTIPGSAGPVKDAQSAARVADDVGWPVVLKAAGGGGGRGIRVVARREDLDAAFAIAAREAEAGFGDGRLYVERFIRNARHVEVQVLGDSRTVLHLYERECSLQRRRQKVVEEAPAPSLSEEVRDAMCAAAVRLAEAVQYRSAGTVEFLLDMSTCAFFFIEMNTRIQVEHPVTEVTCGIDIVAEQLRIAAGHALSVRQEDISPRGAAIELRLTAEDAAQGWAPSPGRVTRAVLPAGPWVRVDSWIESGCEVSPYYDALLAKLVVWGEDRGTAIQRARRALRELRVDGITSTAATLSALLEQRWFVDGQFHTGTIEAWLGGDRTP